MKIKDDDYIIYEFKGKPRLVVVLNGKSNRGVIEKTLISDDPENIDIDSKFIIANLGSNPRVGKAFGVDIKPYKRTIETSRYGPIHIFRATEKGEISRLKKSMDAVYDLFKKKVTSSIFPFTETVLEPKQGKYAGLYKFKSHKGLEFKDTVVLRPDTFKDPKYNEYILAHEWSHAIWFRCVSPHIRAKWLKLYQKRVTLSQIESNELSDLCEDVIKYDGGFRAYKKEIGDERVVMILREVETYFKRYHKLSVQDVELMLREDSSTFAEIWPTTAKLTEDRPDISEYAMTKVEEFFAEALAYYVLGRTLPKDVQKGVDYTVKRLGSFADD